MTVASEPAGPPFRGDPCPVCPGEVRAVAALLHNFLVRWPENDAFVQLDWLRKHAAPPTSAHPVVRGMLSVATALQEAVAEGLEDDGIHVKWTGEVRERVTKLVPRAEASMYVLQPMIDEHFRDRRHSHGEANVLRANRGATAIRFLPKLEWDYYVSVVSDNRDAHLVHSPCGTGLLIHRHFRDQLKSDPSFYGAAFCPTCRSNRPFSEFERLR